MKKKLFLSILNHSRETHDAPIKNQSFPDHKHAPSLTQTDTAAGVSQHMVNKLTHSLSLSLSSSGHCRGGVFYSPWNAAQFGFI